MLPVVAFATGTASAVFEAGGAQPSLASVARAEAALVLTETASESAGLADRIAAAAALYRTGKVTKLLLSGEPDRSDYDEVAIMRRALLARGVPPEDLFTDHAGGRAAEKAERARHVFGIDSVVVVTMAGRMRRALYAVRGVGLQASGYSEDRRAFGRTARPRQGPAYVDVDPVV